MSYSDFLELIKRNTSNELGNYQELCRICLENHANGVDISENSCSSIKQREAIQNNYNTITKQYLSLSDELPKFVCWGCETNLSRLALFAQQIEQNATNWEIFLQNGSDIKDYDSELNQIDQINEIEEIKIEYCDDEIYENGPDTEPNISDALQNSKVEETVGTVKEASTDATIQRRKIDYSEPRPLFVSLSTDYERTCKLCDEPTFSSLARFYKHQRQNHPDEKSFICGICNSGFNNKSRLVTHMKDRHAKWGKKHQCQFCAKLFFTDREVKGHEKLHLNARSYVCNLCGKGFNQKTILNIHMKSKAHNANYKTFYKKKKKTYRAYNNNSKKSFRCQLCVPSSVFATPEERTAHRNAMHRKYECNICKNSFMAQESLDCHKLLHSDKPRPFVCTVCDATFNQSSHLASHFKRKHTDEKTFHCSHCDRSFFESCELNAHVKLVHRKQDRVKCSQCSCDFATEKYLQKHVLQKHTTEASPYDCKICGKRNENGVRLDQHRLKYHRFVD
ncbi:zinc finger protein 25-like isoform X3 [Bradysia coprophila]|uniref:zinc finger protein 25-like isoform X3 n=1 Tax=Bradysia coprophila TaxID=38358 RepID=UPI00187DAFBC|nr:zinc finger protein 25-like isoform X3 [Bradysia coprophila]